MTLGLVICLERHPFQRVALTAYNLLTTPSGHRVNQAFRANVLLPLMVNILKTVVLICCITID